MTQAADTAGDQRLPIDDVVDDVRAVLAAGPSLVVVAPPGAGKTTRLPLVFLKEPWCQGRRLILVEPRRLAARAAAERMAALIGERVGGTVGLRARLDTQIGSDTRIEVVTEGVFTCMILDDPTLDGIAAVIFDEFHERALDADFGLALALDAQAGLRDDLKLIVMSATLDGARVAALLPSCCVVESQGRAFPVETVYAGRARDRRLEDHVAATVLEAMDRYDGDVLVFLPGQRDIERAIDAISVRVGRRSGQDLDVVPLYGALPYADQRRAIARRVGETVRKVIVSTAISESALTIDGVGIVVDAGFSRVPRYDAGCGLNRLDTVRVSLASADQRRGRAGRTSPGVCYRLWDEPETRALLRFDQPEILSSDLKSLVLDCAEWGVTTPVQLSWLDAPPNGLWEAAQAELMALGALDRGGRLTDAGRRIRQLPMPARLARMVLQAAKQGRHVLRLATRLSVVLVERGVGGSSTDAAVRVRSFAGLRDGRHARLHRLAETWAAAASRLVGEDVGRGVADGGSDGHELAGMSEPEQVSGLLMMAFPDRIAMARGQSNQAPQSVQSLPAGQFIMTNGRAAHVSEADPLARQAFIVVADLQGQAKAPRVLLAAPVTRELVEHMAEDRIVRRQDVRFDPATKAVVGRDVVQLDALILDAQPTPVLQSPDVQGPDVQDVLARGVADMGITDLSWSNSQRQLLARARFLKRIDGQSHDGLPDVSEAHLATTVEDWLAPYLAGLTRRSEITADVLAAALDGLLPINIRRQIETAVPTHFEVPTGSRIPIDYEGEGAPAISVRVQEVFGLNAHPAIDRGRMRLTLKLLSPAHRPIQITDDLPGFWAGSWGDVKADMKGRYPKHVWPDDPANARPTSRAKPRA
ncbi:MAG: ATP-dependent helicase HrpB [Pseudomonadota bacterium]